MIQIIDRDNNKYTLLINNNEYIFIPILLYKSNSLLPLKSFVPKGKSVIKWKVNGKQISYNQIKKAIRKN